MLYRARAGVEVVCPDAYAITLLYFAEFFPFLHAEISTIAGRSSRRRRQSRRACVRLPSAVGARPADHHRYASRRVRRDARPAVACARRRSESIHRADAGRSAAAPRGAAGTRRQAVQAAGPTGVEDTRSTDYRTQRRRPRADALRPLGDVAQRRVGSARSELRTRSARRPEEAPPARRRARRSPAGYRWAGDLQADQIRPAHAGYKGCSGVGHSQNPARSTARVGAGRRGYLPDRAAAPRNVAVSDREIAEERNGGVKDDSLGQLPSDGQFPGWPISQSSGIEVHLDLAAVKVTADQLL